MSVSPELHDFVLKRDGICFLARLDYLHKCFGRYGVQHDPTDLNQLTLDHVHDEAMLGKRAPDDARHLVALCAKKNIDGVSRAVRQAQRAYLKALYETEGDIQDVGPV